MITLFLALSRSRFQSLDHQVSEEVVAVDIIYCIMAMIRRSLPNEQVTSFAFAVVGIAVAVAALFVSVAALLVGIWAVQSNKKKNFWGTVLQIA